MNSVKLDNDITWDGKCIAVWASTERGRVECKIPRKTIHAMPRFSDAISREINRDREEIVDRLRAALISKIARLAEGDHIVLEPQDLQSV